MIINFIVVTKGAGRTSEVIARFTLDALPGKQMAIDADLNSGLITQEQATERRQEVAQESDFLDQWTVLPNSLGRCHCWDINTANKYYRWINCWYYSA